MEGKFAGQKVDDVVAAIKARKEGYSVKDLPIDIVSRNGVKYILNTRSSAALTEAGIPRQQWNVVNRTGQNFYENLLTNNWRRII